MGIPTGIIDLFYHPPVGSLHRSQKNPTPLFNPYSGSGSLVVTKPGVIPGTQLTAVGFRWSVNSAPQEAGRSVGATLEYEQAFFSFALHYTLQDGTDFVGDSIRTGLASGFWLFNIALPSTMSYFILPGWTLHFDWLVNPLVP